MIHILSANTTVGLGRWLVFLTKIVNKIPRDWYVWCHHKNVDFMQYHFSVEFFFYLSKFPRSKNEMNKETRAKAKGDNE